MPIFRDVFEEDQKEDLAAAFLKRKMQLSQPVKREVKPDKPEKTKEELA